ncbi:MAG: hypothetical protein HC802_13095 [Caldilineaceae bacterium]|nr:hypothetical protein [Caldilineaceae bacterium]
MLRASRRTAGSGTPIGLRPLALTRVPRQRDQGTVQRAGLDVGSGSLVGDIIQRHVAASRIVSKYTAHVSTGSTTDVARLPVPGETSAMESQLPSSAADPFAYLSEAGVSEGAFGEPSPATSSLFPHVQRSEVSTPPTASSSTVSAIRDAIQRASDQLDAAGRGRAASESPVQPSAKRCRSPALA